MMHYEPPKSLQVLLALVDAFRTLRVLAVGVFAMSIISCTTYQVQAPQSAIEYCAQSPEFAGNSRPASDEFEAIPIENWKEVFAAKEKHGQRVLIFSNKMLKRDIEYNKFFSKFLWFRTLAGSKILVVLSSGVESASVLAAEKEIERKYPEAKFVRPWMAEVRLVPVSPWIVRRQVVLPCQGFPMGDVPMEFLLDREETLILDALPNDALVLIGTLSFLDMISGHFFHQSFSVRKVNLLE